MTKALELDIDFSDPDYQQVLTDTQSGQGGLQFVSLLDIRNDEVLCSHSNGPDAQKQGNHWLDLGKSLFSQSADGDHTISQTVQLGLLCFSDDIIAVLRDTPAAGSHLATVLEMTDDLEQRIQELIPVSLDSGSDKIRQLPYALSFESNGTIKHHNHSNSPDTAKTLFSQPAQLLTLSNGLLGNEAMHPFRTFLKGLKLPSQALKRVFLDNHQLRIFYLRLPFLPNYILMLINQNDIAPNALQDIAENCANELLRVKIGAILEAGIEANTDLPETDKDWQDIINELRKINTDNLVDRLIVGGFADHSVGEAGEMEDGAMVLRCQECIYYLKNRKWCDLPELPLPVEPEWYCRLWRL